MEQGQVEPMVDVKKVAEVTGTPRSWWYSAAAANRVPAHRIGKYLRFRLSEVEAWIESQRAGR